MWAESSDRSIAEPLIGDHRWNQSNQATILHNVCDVLNVPRLEEHYLRKRSASRRLGIIQNKAMEVANSFLRLACILVGHDQPSPDLVSSNNENQKLADDYKELMNNLKTKVQESCSKSEQIQLLTLTPSSWNHEKISEHFNCSPRSSRLARNIKKNRGILPTITPHTGRKISDEVKRKIVDFYEHDDSSRQCAGKKEFKSIKMPETGKRLHIQKRLLLGNIKELHSIFLSQNQDVKVRRLQYYIFTT
jgi:hypothetical protein